MEVNKCFLKQLKILFLFHVFIDHISSYCIAQIARKSSENQFLYNGKLAKTVLG